MTGVNIDRLHPCQTTPMYRDHRVVESLGLTYACHYPSKVSEMRIEITQRHTHAITIDRKIHSCIQPLTDSSLPNLDLNLPLSV